MSPAPTATPHEPSTLAAVLSYLIPGLGQLYQGRYGKGALFMVSLLGMFMLGQAMGQWQNVYLPRGEQNVVGALSQRWHYLGQFWIGVAAWPAIVQYNRVPPPPDQETSFFSHYQRMPEPIDRLNDFLRNSDKTPDLGWVYTVIAGMLNLLVIYDAYAGQLLHASVRSRGSESLAPKPEAKKEVAL